MDLCELLDVVILFVDFVIQCPVVLEDVVSCLPTHCQPRRPTVPARVCGSPLIDYERAVDKVSICTHIPYLASVSAPEVEPPSPRARHLLPSTVEFG